MNQDPNMSQVRIESTYIDDTCFTYVSLHVKSHLSIHPYKDCSPLPLFQDFVLSLGPFMGFSMGF